MSPSKKSHRSYFQLIKNILNILFAPIAVTNTSYPAYRVYYEKATYHMHAAAPHQNKRSWRLCAVALRIWTVRTQAKGFNRFYVLTTQVSEPQ